MSKLGRKGKVGLGMILLIVVLTTFAPLFLRWGPEEIDRDSILSPPSSEHALGTDRRGMDVLTRTIYSPRVDLFIAFSATCLAMIVGIPLGAIAGVNEGHRRLGGALSQFIMRSMDVLQAIPVFVFALAVVAVLGRGSFNVILALGFVNAPVFVRLVRAEVLVQRERPFVEAATLAGWSKFRVAFRHVLPNSLTATIGQAPVVLGYCILLTAGLSFVGAGVQVPTAEWGVMIAEGAGHMVTGQWWPAVPPGAAIALTVVAFALLGEDIRESIGEGRMRFRLRRARWRRRVAEMT